MKINRAVAEYICMDQVPIYTVEKPGFQQLIKQLNPRYALPSWNHSYHSCSFFSVFYYKYLTCGSVKVGTLCAWGSYRDAILTFQITCTSWHCLCVTTRFGEVIYHDGFRRPARSDSSAVQRFVWTNPDGRQEGGELYCWGVLHGDLQREGPRSAWSQRVGPCLNLLTLLWQKGCFFFPSVGHSGCSNSLRYHHCCICVCHLS